MKPKTLYNSPSIHESKTIDVLSKYISDYVDMDNIQTSFNEKIVIKYYILYVYDNGDRTYELFSVWFENKPIMVCHEVGDGEEYYNNYITDKDSFDRMITYIKSLPLYDEKAEVQLSIYAEDDDIIALDEYSGFSLSDFYVAETVYPQYKEGDIIECTVKENHVRDKYAFDKTKYINTRCRVEKVFPHNPSETYSVKQLDRRWETVDEKKSRGCSGFGEIVVDVDKGEIYAIVNDGDIIKKLI